MDLSLLFMFGLIVIAAPIGFYFGKRSLGRVTESPQVSKQSEHYADRLFADAPIGYLELDQEGIVQRANRCECILRGVTADQLVGKAYWELGKHDGDQSATESLLREFVANRNPEPRRDQYVRADGTVVVVEIHKHNLNDHAGRTQGARLASVNVTEQVRAELQMAKATQELKAVFDAFPDSFLRFDAAHVILDYKGAKGAELENSVGRRVEEVLKGEAGERLATAIDNLMRTHSPVSVDFPRTIKGQQRFFEARLASIHWTEAIALIRDITEQKVVNDKLQDFARELQEKNDQLADALITAREATRFKTRFLANMSHEIRTPINGVLGMTELLLDTSLNDEQADCARTILEACHSLIQMVDHVLDLSRMESGKFTIEQAAFDLRAAIDEVIQPLASIAQLKGLKVTSQIDANVPTSVRGDPVRFRQILGNLLSNAMKFTEQGGISVRTELAGEIEGAFTLRFIIKDTGIGVRADQIPRLFDSFVQADDTSTRKYGGAGLGLAIAKQLVELMRGEIGAESTPGEGSTFWFTAVFEKQASEETVDVRIDLDLRNCRVLLVEDSAAEREHIRGRLESWGAECDEVTHESSTLDALRNAAGGGRPFKLALIAMDMQGQDGMLIGHAIKSDAQVGDTVLIALTDAATRGHGPVLRAVGFDGHVQKPVLAADLRDTISEAMAAAEERAQAPPSAPRRPEVVQGGPRPEGKARILVVEDDDVNQKVVLRILQKIGFQADLAVDGRRAVDAVLKNHYDLVLMDVQMPRMDGLEATAQIRFREGSSRHTPIIGLTANALSSDRERCLGAGMDDYLSKPVSNERLRTAISHWVGKN
jgi:two-component system sensor histidine kinase/response regulator